MSDLEAVLRLLGGGSAAGHAARGVVEEAVEGAAALGCGGRSARPSRPPRTRQPPVPPQPGHLPGRGGPLLSKRFLPPSVIDPFGFGFPLVLLVRLAVLRAAPVSVRLGAGMSGSKVSPPSPFPSSEDVAAAFTALESTALRLAGGRPTLPPLVPPALVARLLDGGGAGTTRGCRGWASTRKCTSRRRWRSFGVSSSTTSKRCGSPKETSKEWRLQQAAVASDSSSSSRLSSSSSSVGGEYGDEDVLVAVGHLLNDAVDPPSAPPRSFPRGKGDPMRLLRRLESLAAAAPTAAALCSRQRQQATATATATATAPAPPMALRALRTATIPSAT